MREEEKAYDDVTVSERFERLLQSSINQDYL